MKTLLKKTGVLVLTLTFCFTAFSFQSSNYNEKQLSDLNNYSKVENNYNPETTNESAAWTRVVVKTARKAWQRNYVLTAVNVATTFFGASNDDIQNRSQADLMRDVKLAKL